MSGKAFVGAFSTYCATSFFIETSMSKLSNTTEDGLGMVSSCRYSNVPWSDCDPLTWLRTKTVNLVKDKKYRSVSLLSLVAII